MKSRIRSNKRCSCKVDNLRTRLGAMEGAELGLANCGFHRLSHLGFPPNRDFYKFYCKTLANMPHSELEGDARIPSQPVPTLLLCKRCNETEVTHKIRSEQVCKLVPSMPLMLEQTDCMLGTVSRRM